MKENTFSIHSANYSKFRPVYPGELFDLLMSYVSERKYAWDCGTGNGQVAQELSKYFEKVFATDISPQQIEQALPNDKIQYSIQKAEKTIFPDNTFDLITVAQAIHWFDFYEFYNEVFRTMKHNGILAVFGYGLFRTFREADPILQSLYFNILGPFWGEQRRYIDKNYETIPFPFVELEKIDLEIVLEWRLDHLIGYLETWSATKNYMKVNNKNPIDLIYDDLKKVWGNEHAKTVKFPIISRIGRVEKI